MANILKLIPTLQSVAIMSDNLEFAKKKKHKSTDFVKQGVKNLVGVSLVNETAKFID